MKFTNEEKEYIKKCEEKFHALVDEEKEYIIKIKKRSKRFFQYKRRKRIYNQIWRKIW